MPLDSGALSTLRPRDRFVYTLQNALAIQQNIPITFIRADAPETFSKSSPPPLLPHVSRRSVLERCEVFQTQWRAWKKYMQEMGKTQYAYPPSYANPGIRLLRDYWSWSWSEVLVVIDEVAAFSKSKTPFSFPANAGFSKLISYYIAPLNDELYLLLGPFLQLGDISAREAESELRREIELFNDTVAQAWNTLPDSDRLSPWPRNAVTKPVYGADYILRQLFSRARVNSRDVEERAQRIALYFQATEKFFSKSVTGFRPDAVMQFVTSFAAYHELGGTDSREGMVIALPAIENDHLSKNVFRVDSAGTELVVEADARLAMSVKYQSHVQRLADTCYTTWNSYNYETFVLLRNYLNRKFGVYVTPQQKSAGGIPTKVGDRIVRLAARLFEAEEAAIYRVNYAYRDRPLFRYGFYTEFLGPEMRGALMLEHMTSIAAGQDTRQASISYRSIDTQLTQVCDFYDQETNEAIPSDQTLSFPRDVQSNWGRSACASPIIINGQTWGAVELISDRPWTFYVQVVKKLEELCSLVGPFFYYQGLLASLSDIYRLIVDQNLVFNQKVHQVCKILPDLFMADSAAIYFRRQENTFTPFAAIFREDLDPYLDGGGSERRGTKAFESSLLENIAVIEDFVIGEPPFDASFFALSKDEFFSKRIGHRLLAIPLADVSDNRGNPVFGLITLLLNPRRFKESVISSDEISSAYEFLKGYLTVAFQMVYASYVWEGSTRSYLSHEVTRLAIEFESRLSRAREATRRLRLDESQNAIRYRIAQSLSDLESNLKDLEHFNAIFKSISVIERSDPLVAAAKRLRETERHKRVETIYLREITNEIFLSRQTQSQKFHIKIVNDIVSTMGVRMSARNLREALGNLADNAIKYAQPSSTIEVKAYLTPRGEISLVIANLGPPMTEEERRRVFEEGFRAQYAYEKGIPGMGRGLSYAREIIRIYEGDLRYRLHPRGVSTKEEGQGKALWHEVEVRLPADLVVQGGRK